MDSCASDYARHSDGFGHASSMGVCRAPGLERTRRGHSAELRPRELVAGAQSADQKPEPRLHGLVRLPPDGSPVRVEAGRRQRSGLGQEHTVVNQTLTTHAATQEL